MIDRNLEAYCGLYCGSCPVHLKQFDNWLVQAVLERLKCTEADLDCHGCRAETISLSCRDCDRRDCAQSKGFDSCSTCSEMPCDRMRSYRLPHMSEAVPNLMALRERGSNAWLAEQAEHWACASCSKTGSWYEQVCPQCGTTLASGHQLPEQT
ncbi:DUF3795 domain-containing protein [Candidatus Bipolaricaulota bacterium]